MLPAENSDVKVSRDSAWAVYWDWDTLWSKSRIWEINARLFVKKTAPLLRISKSDRVLDIGCGAGHTAELLAPGADSYLGVDTSENLLSAARERCRHFSQTSFEEIRKGSPNFSRFGKFSLFLCVSVIQYYPDAESVLELVAKASHCALPNARMLIADIPQPRSLTQTAGDFFASLAQSVQEGYALSYLRTLIRLPFSQYRKFSKKNPVLEISIEDLNARISELGFKTAVIHESVSICARRPSLLIQF